jgi:4-hydroxy-tetrahydrodipicolinate synthase
MKFGSVLTEMVTPFDENGKVDFGLTEQLVAYLLANGTEGLVIAGTTGESPTLTHDEKLAFFGHVVNIVNKRVPVIAGTGSNNTAETIALTKEVEDLGVDAAMLVAPYYNKPDQRGMYAHFSGIAQATELPLMLYNIPGRSVVKMNADTIVELSKIPNIVSVKEASGDLDQAAEIIARTADDFSVYSGDDSMTLPLLSLGANGVVSVASHVIGNEMMSMVKAFQAGNVNEAAGIHRRILPVMKVLFSAPSPVPVKAALKLKGIETGNVRLPLVSLEKFQQEHLEQVLRNYSVID